MKKITLIIALVVATINLVAQTNYTPTVSVPNLRQFEIRE